MIEKPYIYDHMPPDTKVDDFYVLEIQVDREKIKQMGYDDVDCIRYIKEVMTTNGYIMGIDLFFYTAIGKGTMFSFYRELKFLMKQDWFKESLITAPVYRKVADNVDLWYKNDYAIEYYETQKRYANV